MLWIIWKINNKLPLLGWWQARCSGLEMAKVSTSSWPGYAWAPGGWGWSSIRQPLRRNFETQHLAEKSPLAQRFPGDAWEAWGGSGSKENAESCFSWGGVHLSLSLSMCTLSVKESYQIPPIIGCWWPRTKTLVEPFVVSHTIKWDCVTDTKATL